MSVSVQKTTVRDGKQIAYRVYQGSGQARFALTHSLATDGAFWARTVEHLKDAGTVLAIDCRGHGQSDKPAGPYTVEQYADDLADVMTAIGWDKAIIGGASMGGCVSLTFALKYPERTQALGLIDTTAGYGDPAAWEDRAKKAKEGGMAALIGFQKSRWVSEKFLAEHPEVVDEAIKTFLANDLDAYVATCRMMGAIDNRNRLGEIKAPTSIVVGSEDYATPVSHAEFLHKGIAGSTFEVLEGVRHFTPLECPDVIASKLRALVARA
jgi:3-oxoadipate enol-lactonase